MEGVASRLGRTFLRLCRRSHTSAHLDAAAGGRRSGARRRAGATAPRGAPGCARRGARPAGRGGTVGPRLGVAGGLLSGAGDQGSSRSTRGGDRGTLDPPGRGRPVVLLADERTLPVVGGLAADPGAAGGVGRGDRTPSGARRPSPLRPRARGCGGRGRRFPHRRRSGGDARRCAAPNRPAGDEARAGTGTGRGCCAPIFSTGRIALLRDGGPLRQRRSGKRRGRRPHRSDCLARGGSRRRARPPWLARGSRRPLAVALRSTTERRHRWMVTARSTATGSATTSA